MKYPLSGLPGQKPSLTVTTLYLRIRAALCRSQSRAPSPQTQRPFFRGLVTSLHIPGCREPREACLPLAWHGGWESGEGGPEQALAETRGQNQVGEAKWLVPSPGCHAGHVQPRPCTEMPVCRGQLRGAGWFPLTPPAGRGRQRTAGSAEPGSGRESGAPGCCWHRLWTGGNAFPGPSGPLRSSGRPNDPSWDGCRIQFHRVHSSPRCN